MPLPTGKIAVLPLGAYEFHGGHLPFETDAIIAGGVAECTARMLPDDMDVVFLPTEEIGYSVEHGRHAQTKTLEFDEAVRRWIDIGCDCYHQGIAKFVMLNAHGGNSPLMSVVTTELRRRFPMLAVATSWTRFPLPQGLISEEEKTLDIHGGFLETSLMLAIAPEKVCMEKAENFANSQADYSRQFTHLRAYGRHAFGWMMEDINKKGAAGNAQRATVQAGEKILKSAAEGIVTLLQDIHRFDLAQFSRQE